MGCGSSSSGRDTYATLSAEPEQIPLVKDQDDLGHRPVNSFLPTIAPLKQESSEVRDRGYSHREPEEDEEVPPQYQQLDDDDEDQYESGQDSGDLTDNAPPSPPPAEDLFKGFPTPHNFEDAAFDEQPKPTIEKVVAAPPPLAVSEAEQHKGEGKDKVKKKKKRKSSKKRHNSKDVVHAEEALKPPKPQPAGEEEEGMAHKHRPDDTPQPSSASGMRFDELYRLKGVLGTGAFSTVREGYHRSSTEITYAVKCVNRKKLSEEDEAALLDEVAILQELKHLHIIRLYDFFIEPSTYYLIMERMSGGELFDRIVAKAYYSEKEARDVCKIVIEAVQYCHQNHVAHRDLKPENLLLLSQEDDSTVKIADFGFAKKCYQPESLTTQCGTPGYVAPEILEGTPYDTRADMWSVGVILYILLGGYPPFIENNQRDLFRKIRKGEYEFHEEYWGTVSEEAKDLISSLLTVDPVTRLDAEEALQNPWIRYDDDVLARRDLGVNLKELTKFNAKRKFKAAVSTVMAVNKLQSLGKDFLKNLS